MTSFSRPLRANLEVIMSRRLTSAVSAAVLMLGVGIAEAADKVTFSLNWVPYGLHYGIFAAEAQGYYREAGLDIDIQRGYGSGDTVKRTATGAADIGMADMASVIVGRGNGLNVKQVATLLDRSADAIFYLKGIGINAPKDLSGRTLGATVGETTLNLLPVFAANAGFDHKKVEIINLAAPAKFPAFVSKKVDAIVAFRTEEPGIRAAAEKANVAVDRFMFSDFGVDYYSIGFIVSDETLAKRPDMVKRFLAATLRGYAFAFKDPQAAADLFIKRFPESNRDLSFAQWTVSTEHVLTERTRANGLGYIDRAKMQHTLDLITRYQEIKQTVGLDDIYSSGLLTKVEAGK
jgi:NitT/TauT family transport system substrate-binding protein